jgi:hypothetical protein
VERLVYKFTARVYNQKVLHSIDKFSPLVINVKIWLKTHKLSEFSMKDYNWIFGGYLDNFNSKRKVPEIRLKNYSTEASIETSSSIANCKNCNKVTFFFVFV